MPRNPKQPETYSIVADPEQVQVFYRGNRYDVVVRELEKTIEIPAAMSKHEILERMALEIDLAWREGAAYGTLVILEGR